MKIEDILNCEQYFVRFSDDKSREVGNALMVRNHVEGLKLRQGMYHIRGLVIKDFQKLGLNFEVYECRNQLPEDIAEELDKKYGSIKDETDDLDDPEKEHIVYFETRDEYVKAGHYLSKNGINVLPMGFGGMKLKQRLIDALRGRRFSFKIAKTYEEFCENIDHREKYRQEVIKHIRAFKSKPKRE